jgi:aspartyl-tRNA(Asn)/glutamyl-tRNA(Gln) amidotransferase subunit A
MKAHPNRLAETASELRSGKVSATRLWDTAQDRHGEWGEKLNAYVAWAPELGQATAQAADAAFAAGIDLGPLQGLPLSFKDHYGVESLPTYAGSSKRLPVKWEHEGHVVKDTKRQLAVITGKTQTVEFAASTIGDNPHWGAPRNPWDADTSRGPGGSSSGAAVSLWEGSAMAAFGTDTRGSIRMPGSMSGVVGLKITADRWSKEGIVPFHPRHDTPGPLTLSVQDAAYVFAALDPAHRSSPFALLNDLSGAAIGDFVIGVADECFWENCSPGITEAVKVGLAELEAGGARLRDVTSSEAQNLTAAWMKGELHIPELFAFIEDELPDWIEQLEPRLASRNETIRDVSVMDYLKRELWLDNLASTASQCFSGVDVIVSPTVPRTSPILVDGQPDFKETDPPQFAFARNTCPANFFGWCAITLPIGFDAENMPVGLQMMARGRAEETLLAVASAAERIVGNVQERLGSPPLLS